MMSLISFSLLSKFYLCIACISALGACFHMLFLVDRTFKNRGLKKIESYFQSLNAFPIVASMTGSVIEQTFPGLIALNLFTSALCGTMAYVFWKKFFVSHLCRQS
jgi:hypothetical protein